MVPTCGWETWGQSAPLPFNNQRNQPPSDADDFDVDAQMVTTE